MPVESQLSSFLIRLMSGDMHLQGNQSAIATPTTPACFRLWGFVDGDGAEGEDAGVGLGDLAERAAQLDAPALHAVYTPSNFIASMALPC
jgi:hypothetical protein